MRKIKKIEPTIPQIPARKKVAAYARVSVESERLHHSLSAQVSFYNNLIQKNPMWEFAGIYADEGISGTGTEKRGEFNRMLADCEAGKIDIILTKSISRFARNTVDLLEIVRHLKELGIEIRFEKENINTLSEEGELMLTLLASFAQEESRSISDNVKWGMRKKMQQGVPTARTRLLGYRWEDDQLILVPEEAEIVKRIFQNFLDGKSRLETERELEAEGIRSINGSVMRDSNIKKILTNITYTGNLLLQKEFIADPISKKRKQNQGELPQYLVENTHQAIIDRETFDFVQAEIARRKELGPFANKSLNITCFTSKLKCRQCACSFVRSVRKNKAKHTSTYGDEVVNWVCGTTKRKGGHCSTKDIPENILRSTCAKALGIPEFDEELFLERTDHIDVLADNSLEFHFKDGTTSTYSWKSTAKKDCWTEEQKDLQREWIKNHMAKGEGRYFPFTTRIVCEQCGLPFRRALQKNKSAEGGKIGHWRCTCDKQTGTCVVKSLREDHLMALTAEVMGTSQFSPDKFMADVERITVSQDMTLSYHFKDGSCVARKYDFKRKGTPWTDEQRAKFRESTQGLWTDERKKEMSERMKQIRRDKKWPQEK